MNLTTRLATQAANTAFDNVNEMIPEEMLAVDVILALPSADDSSGLSVGVCLCDELNTRQKAILFKQIAEQLAEAAVEEDVAAQAEIADMERLRQAP